MNENKRVFGLRGNSKNLQQQKQVAETEHPEMEKWHKVSKEYLRHLVYIIFATLLKTSK